MKRTNKRKVVIALALASSIPLLTGCGPKESGLGLNGIGQVPGSIYGPGGCIPINATIPFTATNIYFGYANIVGGRIPDGRTVGSVALGGAAAGGPYQRSGVDGTLSMNIVPVNAGAQPVYGGYQPSYNQTASTASANGIITIAPATQQDILYTMGGMTGTPTTTYPTTPTMFPGAIPMPTAPTSICVSAVAFDVGHYNNTIYGGHVFLYLNNSTQHGYKLYF